MKILVTGGSGFLGRNLIEYLIGKGHEISCIDRYIAPFLEEYGVRTIRGDIYEKMAIEEAVEGMDVIVHMACTTLPKTSNDDPYFDVLTNVGGTIRLLDSAVKNNVKKLVFISSGGTVYGTPEEVPIKETHPTNPECSYGITKLTIEKYLQLYMEQKGLNTCVLRLANPYGKYQRYKAIQGAIPVFCYKALQEEPIQIWGDGTVKRDFVAIEDTIRAICMAIESSAATGVFNIGGGGAFSLNEILDCIEQIIGRKLIREYGESRPFDVPISYLDISKAAQIIGWKPEIDIETGIRTTIEWIKSCISMK